MEDEPRCDGDPILTRVHRCNGAALALNRPGSLIFLRRDRAEVVSAAMLNAEGQHQVVEVEGDASQNGFGPSKQVEDHLAERDQQAQANINSA